MTVQSSDSDALTFIWLRHARPLVAKGYIYGCMEEVPLNLTGHKTRKAFNAIASLIPDNAHIVTSPSPRAKTSIQEISKHLKVEPPVTEDARFKEQSFGDWEGKNKSDLTNDAAAIAYLDDPENTAPPNGETLAQVFARVEEAANKYIKHHANDALSCNTIVVSAHAGVVRAALAIANGTKASGMLAQNIRRLSATVTRYHHQTGEWEVIAVNRTL